MHDAPASAPMTTDNEQRVPAIRGVGGVEGVVVSPLPSHAPLAGRVLWQALTAFGIIAAVAVSIWVGLALKGSSPRSWLMLLAGAGISAFVSVCYLAFAAAARRRNAIRAIEENASPWGVAVAECTRDARALWPRERVDETWRSLLRRPDRPRAVVDEELTPAIAAIPRPSQLLEPEPVSQSERGMLVPAVVFLVLGGSAFVDRGGDVWWRMIIFLSLSVYFFSRVPAIRDRIPILRATGLDLVAGPGWLRRRDGRRWSGRDSVLIVMRSGDGPEASRSKPGIVVRLVGPIGVRDLTFSGASDPQFATLWQRWMHPVPRYDLDA